MDMLVSRRSTRQTPRIGAGASTNVLPGGLAELGMELDLSQVEVPLIKEPTVNQEQILLTKPRNIVVRGR